MRTGNKITIRHEYDVSCFISITWRSLSVAAASDRNRPPNEFVGHLRALWGEKRLLCYLGIIAAAIYALGLGTVLACFQLSTIAFTMKMAARKC